MPFTVDFLDDGRVLEWTATGDGADVTERGDYTPRFHVASRSADADVDLEGLRAHYERHPDVAGTAVVRRRPGFRRDRERVLAVDAVHVDRVSHLARQVRQHPDYPAGDVACFDVDFSRAFRYCLETDSDPTPAADLSTLRIGVPVAETAGDAYGELTVGDETVTGPPADVLGAVADAVSARDPDVLVCSTAEVVPTLHEMARDAGRAFTLSRWPGVDDQQLAGRSTYASYGRVGHSPARYNVPGRAIVDESNTFFYGETNLDGVL
ncbi:MAG: DNA polymerase I, partial [Halobacteriaceae archaeon]